MNKILEKLYHSVKDDDFDSEESSEAYGYFYDTFTADMSLEYENKFFGMLNSYTTAVEKNAFEVGFRTAVQLLMGGGQA